MTDDDALLRRRAEKYLDAIRGKLAADFAPDDSDASLERILGPCVGGHFLVPCAKLLRDEGVGLITVTVPLSRRKVAIIDAIHAERVLKHKWTAFYNKRNRKWYARRKVREAGKQRTVYLHRFIMDAPADKQVDHVDGNGLDCRELNMRLADNSQNHQNMVKKSSNRSGFKGVYRNSSITPRWTARVTHHGRTYHCGTYDSPAEAARAYDKKAAKLFGAFALLNFPKKKGSRRA